MDKRRGYTLLELLLVIGIISLIASMSIVVYRHYLINHRSEKAALEMQNFLAAALNYNNDFGQWPPANAIFNDDETGCVKTIPDNLLINNFIANYVPNQSVTSLFENLLCWGTSGTSQHLFWVALKVPDGNVMLAQRIAAHLPNAIATKNPLQAGQVSCDSQDPQATCYVRVEVVGSAHSSNTGTYIAGIGNCVPEQKTLGSTLEVACQYIGEIGSEEPKTVDYVVTFSCPEGMQGNLIASANYLDVGEAQGDPYVLRTLKFSTNCQNSSKDQTCTLHIDAARAMGWSVASGAHGQIGASYTAYCSAPAEKKPFYHYHFST